MTRIILLTLLIGSLSVAETFGQTFKEKILEAVELMEEGDFESAIEKIDLLIEEEPKAPLLFIIKGDAYQKMDRRFSNDTLAFRRAMDCYNQALEIDAENYSAFLAKGNLYLLHRKVDEAINDFSAAVKYAEDEQERYEALINRGAIFSYTNQFEKAIADYKKVLEIKPDMHSAYSNLAMIFMRKNELTKAEDLCQHAITLAPEDKTYKNNMGMIRMRQERYEEAEQIFSELIENYTSISLALALNNRGFARTKLGKLELASIDIDESIQLYPENSYAYKNKAILLIAQKNKPMACQNLSKAIELGYATLYGTEVQDLMDEHCQ